MKKRLYIVGIDEVGRGPLAGPVTVGVVACERNLYDRLCRDRRLPSRGRDSKKLSKDARETYAAHLSSIVASPSHLYSAVVHVSNKHIDARGIAPAIRVAMKRALWRLRLDPTQCDVRLDGGLRAPAEFDRQQTIIRGDEKEKIIAWASILAKVSRDRLMKKYHRQFPIYGFDKHVGYGTISHRQAIQRHGLSNIHRKSFCKNVTCVSEG